MFNQQNDRNNVVMKVLSIVVANMKWEPLSEYILELYSLHCRTSTQVYISIKRMNFGFSAS